MRTQRSGDCSLSRFSARANGDVYRLVRHVHQAIFHLQFQGQPGMERSQLVQAGDHYVLREQLAHADSHHARNAIAAPANTVLKLANFIKDSAGVLQKNFPFFCQRKAVGSSMGKPQAANGLNVRNSSRDMAGGDIAITCNS